MRYIIHRTPGRPAPRLIAVTTLALCLAAGAVATLMPASPAFAQPQTVQSVTPYSAIVTKDGAAIQCRSGTTAYPVKSLSSGQILKVDGQADNWMQVEYPAGLSAFVKIDEATTQEAGKSLKLTRNSRLMAANADGGVNWWPLLEKELPAGTTFSITKVVKGADGKETGYLVPAPKGSRGFVRKDALRQATQAEIDAGSTAPTTPTTPAATKPPVPELTPITPAAQPSRPAVPEPVKPKPTTSAPVVTDPQPPRPVEPVNPRPIDPNPRPLDPAVKPPDPSIKPPEVTPVKPADVVPPPQPRTIVPAKPLVDAEALNTMYTDAMINDDSQVEIGAVIAEFQKSLDSIEDKPDTQRLRKQLSLRLEALRLRSQLSESLRNSEKRSTDLQQQSQRVGEQVAVLERERHFAAVGRLLSSSVYDGKKLPLMYRVVSSDPSSPRTLAYVVPTNSVNLADNLGKTVGVAGDKKYDEDLKVHVITPSRVEVVTVKAAEPIAPPQPVAPPTIPNDQGTKIEIPVKPAPEK
ncbi:MAG: hypothetical protein H7210_00455 [Pyrinomonadaceae bacterium]|nr:hypothetical protein [Phycisphaerales bacterium]